MHMKSILNQLDKYTGKTSGDDMKPRTQIIVQSEPARKDGLDAPDSLRSLACRIAPYADEAEIKRIVSLLGDLPIHDMVGVLFPLEIWAIYHLYYHHQTQVTSEEHTDSFFMEFFRRQSMQEFKDKFEKSIDETTKRIIMVRVLLATFNKPAKPDTITIHHGRTLYVAGTSKTSSTSAFDPPSKPEDSLPEVPFKRAASDYLGLRWYKVEPSTFDKGGEGCYPGDAVKIQEELNKTASLEQLILGRLGYLMVWHSFAKSKEVFLVPQRALPAPQQQAQGTPKPEIVVVENEVAPPKVEYWLILFEDADRDPEIYTDGAIAQKRFSDLSLNWACMLFKQWSES